MELIVYWWSFKFGRRFWINLVEGLMIVILIAGFHDLWVIVFLLVLILGSLEGWLMEVKLLIMIGIWSWEVGFDSRSGTMMLTYILESLPHVQSLQTHLSFLGWGWWGSGIICFSGWESTSIIKLIWLNYICR